MRIELQFRLTGDGLMGGVAEFAPYLGVWTSFDRYRQPVRVQLTQSPTAAIEYSTTRAVGPYLLDHVEKEFRGDESFWVKMFVGTRVSGVEDIDKQEKDYVVRNIQAGTLSIPLGKILACVNSATGTGTLAHEDLVDTELLQQLLISDRMRGAAPNMQQALNRAHKAFLAVDVRVSELSAPLLQSLTKTLMGHLDTVPGADKPLLANAKTGALLYVPANYEKFAGALDMFIREYADRYIGQIDLRSGAITGPPKYDTKNEGIKGLQFAVYRSMVGMMPVVAFWAHAYMHRMFATREAREEASRLYGYTFETEKYVEAKATAACRRYGMSPEAYVQVVREQHARAADDPTVSSAYRTAVSVLADFGTFTANSVYYTSDERFQNAGRAHPAGETAEQLKNDPIALESWDITAMCMLSNGNDCEDMGNTSTSEVRMLAFGRETLATPATTANVHTPPLATAAELARGSWESPLLRAMQSVAEQYAFYDIGGDVTAAYIGADGKKLEKKDIKDLPLVGDAADTRNQTGGHAYGFAESRARAEMHLANGGMRVDLFGAKGQYARWQYALPSVIFEGTGPIEHLMLPVGELIATDMALRANPVFARPLTASYNSMIQDTALMQTIEASLDFVKAETARRFVREVLAEDAYKPLTEAFRPYAVPFYNRVVEPNRRVTTFYRNAVHAGTVDFYMRHRGLSQVTFVQRKTGERGIDMATLMRDGADGNPSNSVVALDAPYFDKVADWNTYMVPVMEAMVNQMPLTAMGQVPKYQSERPLHFGVMAQPTLLQHLDANDLSVRPDKWFTSVGNVSVSDALPVSSSTSCNECGHHERRKKRERHRDRTDMRGSALLGCSQCGTHMAYNSHSVAVSASVDEETAARVAVDARAMIAAASPMGAALVESVAETVRGGVQWDLVHQMLAWHDQHLDVNHEARTLQAPAVAVSLVEYDMPAALAARTALEASGVSWEPLGDSSALRGVSRRFAVESVALVHTDAAPGSTAIRFVVSENAQEPARADALTMAHVAVNGRIYALTPIVIAAAGTQRTLRHAAHSTASHVQVRSSAGGHYEVSVRLDSVDAFAQAFCTQAHVLAAPWITGDMNASAAESMQRMPASQVVQRQPGLLSYHMGTPADQPVVSAFVDAYKRDDAVLVRFFGHEWSFRKNRDAALACIDRLYKSGHLLAHEFAVCSPLPQCDDVIEVHMLVKLMAGAPAK